MNKNFNQRRPTMKASTLLNLIFSTIIASTISFTVNAAGTVEFSNKAEVEVIMMKDGKKEIKRIPAKKVAPDGEVIYTTTFKNTIDKTISNIVVTNPIPANMAYVNDSASGANTVITYSIDGGKSYDDSAKLIIKTTDGKVRPAQSADFSHIRWVYKGDLATGKSSEVGFRAKVK